MVHPYHEILHSNEKEWATDPHSNLVGLQRVRLHEQVIPRRLYAVWPTYIWHSWDEKTIERRREQWLLGAGKGVGVAIKGNGRDPDGEGMSGLWLHGGGILVGTEPVSSGHRFSLYYFLELPGNLYYLKIKSLIKKYEESTRYTYNQWLVRWEGWLPGGWDKEAAARDGSDHESEPQEQPCSREVTLICSAHIICQLLHTKILKKAHRKCLTVDDNKAVHSGGWAHSF